MNDQLQRCLEDLESRIDPGVEDQLLAEWIDFSEGRHTNGIFSPKRAKAAPPAFEWPKININHALEDHDLMLLHQYALASQALANGTGALMNVRANYGTSLIPLLFGVELFVMPEEMDTLPTSHPFNDTAKIQQLVEAGLPDLNQSYVARAMETGRRFLEAAKQYPKVGKYVHIYHPDYQGPMDVAEVIWGSTLFVSLYEESELLTAFLELVTDTYIAAMRQWAELVPFNPQGNTHWGSYHKGALMIRDDSAMNLSPDLFDQFVKPYDQRLFDEFGGGAVHFCGRGDHYIPSLTQMNGLTAINLSQPHYNDMETIYAHTVDKGIKIVGLDRQAAEEALANGRDLKGCVHCA